MASVLERPKFANSSLGEILMLQYPPLFHAASNVPSFINAMKHLPNMRHITIKTPGQDPKERYRRDIVDYALISLRTSLERAPLHKLTKLTLSSVHPSAFIYLRHTSGFGCLPSAVRRWQQIRKLHVSVEAWDFYGPAPGLDHLKLIDDFIRSFAACLDKFTFAWLGRKGPCPLSLAADPLFAPPRASQKLSYEVTSPMSPLPPPPPRKPIDFRRVRYLAVRNTTMSASQVADLVAAHRHCVREFDFENVVLVKGDSWDDALAPLTGRPSRDVDRAGNCDGEHWTRHSSATILQAASIRPEVVAEDLPTPSAAVAAVSQELLHDDANIFRDEEKAEYEDACPLSDVEAAQQASVANPTKLKKRRVTKHRRKRKESHQRREDEERRKKKHEAAGATATGHRERRNRRERSEESSASQPEKEAHALRRFFHKKSKDSPEEPQHVTFSPSTYSTPIHSRQHSNECLYWQQEPPRVTIPHQPSPGHLFGEIASIHSSPSSLSSRRLFGEITPGSGSEPDLSHSPIDEEDEDGFSTDDYYRPRTPTSPAPPPYSSASAKPMPLMTALSRSPSSSTSSPSPPSLRWLPRIVPSSPSPPSPSSVYSTRTPMEISAPILDTAPSMPTLLQPTVYDPTADLCYEITAVQRDIEAEEAQRRVAEDAEAQVSALRRAKELVLSRLGREFYGSGNGNNCGGGGGGGVGSGAGACNYYGLAPAPVLHSRKENFLGSARFREGLFGRSTPHVASMSTLIDHRSMDVPILFSRS